MGLDTFLEEIQGDERKTEDSDSNADSTNENDSDDDYEKKADSAVDFSDITELAEDLQTSMQAVKTETGDDYDDVEESIPASKVSADSGAVIKGEMKSPTTDAEKKEENNDKELMPPPSVPLKTQTSTDSTKGDATDAQLAAEAARLEKKLETPLAAMLPSKYANVDVRDLFPDFRPDKVLRFSRLFGPGKPSSLPQIWRSVRRRRRRRKHSRDGKVSYFNWSII